MPAVVLLAEDVDRNYSDQRAGRALKVVLLAEDVDRNSTSAAATTDFRGRPPRGGRG